MNRTIPQQWWCHPCEVGWYSTSAECWCCGATTLRVDIPIRFRNQREEHTDARAS